VNSVEVWPQEKIYIYTKYDVDYVGEQLGKKRELYDELTI